MTSTSRPQRLFLLALTISASACPSSDPLPKLDAATRDGAPDRPPVSDSAQVPLDAGVARDEAMVLDSSDAPAADARAGTEVVADRIDGSTVDQALDVPGDLHAIDQGVAPDAGAETAAAPDQAVAPDVPPAAPTISAVAPTRASRGQTVTVEGRHFLPNPRLVLDATDLIPLEAIEKRLTFRVPLTWPFTSCDAPAQLVVRTDAGSSAAMSIVVTTPPPTLTTPSDPAIPAGKAFTLNGSALTGGQVTLGSRALPSTVEADDRVMATIPRDTPTGHADLIIRTPCGEARITIQVTAPAPRVLNADPPTIAADGVLYLTPEHDEVYGVQIGLRVVPANDPTRFQWLPATGSGGRRRLAVRLPATLSQGLHDITLVGRAGPGDPFSIPVVGAPPVRPPSPVRIIVPPERVNDGKTVAVPVTAPHPVATKLDEYGTLVWVYRIVLDPGVPTCSAGKRGRMIGHERKCREPLAGGGSACPVGPGLSDIAECRMVSEFCHPFIDGVYETTETSNSASVTIDRTSSGGRLERYTGGWISADGLPARTGAASYLVLRSQVTGLQILIHHGMTTEYGTFCP